MEESNEAQDNDYFTGDINQGFLKSCFSLSLTSPLPIPGSPLAPPKLPNLFHCHLLLLSDFQNFLSLVYLPLNEQLSHLLQKMV
jgi:hypothetical protein